jgi:hypothetical protein
MSHALVFSAFAHCFRTLSLVVVDLVRLAPVAVAMFPERKVKPRRADDATRWMMAALSRMFRWVIRW